MITISSKEAFEIIERCKKDVMFFNNEILGNTEPWTKQLEVWNAVKDYNRVIVKSGHGIGKTHLAAKIILWYLYCFKESLVITTAPTFLQVQMSLWGEIRKQYNQAKFKLGVDALETAIKVGDKHYAIGISTDEADRIQGFHSDTGNVLVVVDEGCGVDEKMFEALEGLLTGYNCKILTIGNPTATNGYFYKAFESKNWKKYTISCYDCPNVTEGKVVIEGLVTKQWIDEKKEQWGEDSNLFKSRVLGEFPDEDEETLIPLHLVEKAEKNLKIVAQFFEPKILAIDIASTGTNSSIFLFRNGNVVYRIEEKNHKTADELLGFAIRVVTEENPDIIVYDRIGEGWGIGSLLSSKFDNVYEFDSRRADEDTDSLFKNIKAKYYFKLADKFRKENIKILEGTRLSAELPTIKKDDSLGEGKIKIKSKKDMTKKISDSPDYADALMMSEYGLELCPSKEVKPKNIFEILDSAGKTISTNKKLVSSRTGYG